MNEASGINAETMKTELDLFRGRTDKERQTTFLDFFEQFIQQREGNHEYARASILVYKNAQKRLVDYCQETGGKADFKDFDYSFFANLTNYLFSKDYGTNYVHKVTSIH